ncbi:LytR/AlgR family response regulator transcription factor [Dyadobacter crusticola]|uniref:LytR/AlgR family response regulator transcription factor n=1 Tax=Dyadobacter crusticola TaxID=292407 RepID=UPI0004E196FB|nr:LytTR family DNA-binding domain-containing protein [Dyadobacter crusticola]
MIKALIVDDEFKSRSILYKYIREYVPEIVELRIASSVAEAQRVLSVYSPELVFLDIEMPHQNGFELLKAISKPTFNVIFTTAYNQYAIQAIRFSAVDYLLKPIDPADLVVAVRRHLFKRDTAKQKIQRYENLVGNFEKKEYKEFKLAVASTEGIFFFMVGEILRFEADRNYTVIHLKDRKTFIASKTLKYFEDMLVDFKFVRTHKSHLVNLDYIVRISSNNEYLVLTDGSRVEVSRRRKDEVQQHLNIR